jgi:hypothetical protein
VEPPTNTVTWANTHLGPTSQPPRTPPLPPVRARRKRSRPVCVQASTSAAEGSRAARAGPTHVPTRPHAGLLLVFLLVVGWLLRARGVHEDGRVGGGPRGGHTRRAADLPGPTAGRGAHAVPCCRTRGAPGPRLLFVTPAFCA